MKISDLTYRKVIKGLMEDDDEFDPSDPDSPEGTDAQVDLSDHEDIQGTQDGSHPEEDDMMPDDEDHDQEFSPDMSPQPVGNDDKPIDPKIVSMMKTDSYVTDFDHEDGSPYDPMVIAGMNKEDLKSFYKKIKLQLQNREMEVGAGLYGDDTYKFLHKLLMFVKQVKSFT